MEVFVKTLTGRSVGVMVGGQDTVQEVKAKAEVALKTAPDMQHRLYHRGVALKDSLPISSVNLARGEFLALIGFGTRKKLMTSTLPPRTPAPGAGDTGANGPLQEPHPESSLNTGPDRQTPLVPPQAAVSRSSLMQSTVQPHQNGSSGLFSESHLGSVIHTPPQPLVSPSVDIEVIDAPPEIETFSPEQRNNPEGGLIKASGSGEASRLQDKGVRVQVILDDATEADVPPEVPLSNEGQPDNSMPGPKQGVLINTSRVSEQEPSLDVTDGGAPENGVGPPAELRAVQVESNPGGSRQEPARKRLVDSINALSQGKLPEGARKKGDERSLDWADTGVSEPLDDEGTASIARQGPGGRDEGSLGDIGKQNGDDFQSEGVQSMYGREQARVRARKEVRRGPGEMPGSIVGGLLEAAHALHAGEEEKLDRPRRGRGKRGAAKGGGERDGLGVVGEGGRRSRRKSMEEWSDDAGGSDLSPKRGGKKAVAEQGAVPGGLGLEKGDREREGRSVEDETEAELSGAHRGEAPGVEGREADSPVKKRARRRTGSSSTDGPASATRKRRLRKVEPDCKGDEQDLSENVEKSDAVPKEAQTSAEGVRPTVPTANDNMKGASNREANEGLDPAVKEPSRARKRRKLGVTFQDGSVVLDIRTNPGEDPDAADVTDDVGDKTDEVSGGQQVRPRRKGPVVDLSDEDEEEERPAEKRPPGKRGLAASRGKKAQAFDQLSLPPVLARLERVFNALNVVYSFLQRQHVQATWQNVRGAVRATLKDEGAPVTSADVEAIQTLCPQVVLLRKFVGFRPGRGLTLGGVPGTVGGLAAADGVSRGTTGEGNESRTEEESAVKLEMEEIDAEGAEGQESATADGMEKWEDLDGDYSFTIDIVDPMRGPGSLHRIPVISQDDDKDFVSGGFKPIPQLKKQSDKEVTNQIERRRRAFKSRVVELVGRLHQTWAANLPASSEDADSPADFDPWKEATWHPDFPLADVALPDLVEAAKQVDAAAPPAVVSARKALGFRRGYVPAVSNLEQTERGDPDVAVLLEDLSKLYGIELGRESSGSPEPPVSKSSSQGEEDGAVAPPKDIPRPPQQLKKVPRCESTQNFDANEMLEHLKGGLGSLGQVVHTENIAVRQAQFLAPAVRFSDAARKVLETKGLVADQMFTHQAKAINAAMSGRNVVVATSTASGKSLCYNIPVIEAVLAGRQSIGGIENPAPGFEEQAPGPACALYLFPTKALAQDQMRALGELTATLPVQPRVCVYDGDTPFSERPEMREAADVLITNPDMLHVALLPAHKQFRRILSTLRYVVVDEAHAYGGVFGCHTALILRRLRRVCAQVYGSHPTFVVCSATVANPKEHAQELIGIDDWEVVTDDGSPRGAKMFVMWNPPLTSSPVKASGGKAKEYRALVRSNRVMPVAEQSYAERMKKKAIEEGRSEGEFRRSSPIVEVALLLAEFIQHGLRCLAFCKTRKLCELVLTYCRETLKVTAPHLIHTLKSYRAGYTPADRRQIEADLFAGRLRGVCATNALELGVDVGSLDATLHLGYPGSQASLWQQSGRAGRRISDRGSLSVYVAFGGPLDQYFMRDPKRLFGRPVENAQVDSRNWKCLLQHLACAAVENPLQFGIDDVYFGAGMADAIKELSSQGRLGRNSRAPGGEAGALHYIGVEKSPTKGMSLRAIDPEKYAVVNEATNEIIEEVEASKAFFEVYEGSIYMHQGKTFIIEELNLETKIARCRERTVRYYTKTRDMTEVHVIGGNLAYPGKAPDPARYPFTTAKCGRANVSTTWLGFVKIWRGTGEVFDMVDLFLPPVKYTTQAAWVRVPHEVRLEVGEGFREGLHAAGHAILNVLPLYVMCSPNDIGCECASPDDTRFRPERLLVYDKQPDGIGIAVQARPMFAELLQSALELLEACECNLSDGCPGCVHHTGCGEYNRCLDKSGAIVILKSVIAAEAVRKEQGTYEADTGEEAGFFEEPAHGDPGTGANGEQTCGRGAPRVVYEKDHTWDETLKSIEDMLPAEGNH